MSTTLSRRNQHTGPLDATVRFWCRVDKSDNGCWTWTGYTHRGYGRFSDGDGRTVAVHRYAYELLVGPIAEGLTLDHLCRNRACVNPDHLEPVTRGENVLRGDTLPARNTTKTHCPRGHKYPPYEPGKKRNCSICMSRKFRGRWRG